MNDSASNFSGMDVDEDPVMSERVSKVETVFAKSDELLVSFYTHLPLEVTQSLKNAGELDSIL